MLAHVEGLTPRKPRSSPVQNHQDPSIRRADLSKDLKSLKSLDKECFPDDGRESFAECEAAWIAYDDRDKPVGFITVSQSVWPEAGFLSRYGVVASARGRGLGRRLVRAVERYGRTRGWCSIITYTTVHNCPSSNVFIGLGYKTYLPGFAYVGWSDVIYWYKKLSEPSGRSGQVCGLAN